MRITELDRRDYDGFELVMGYDTSFYYALRERGGGTMVTWELVKTPCRRHHVEWAVRLFDRRWEDPRVYAVWDGQTMAAVMEITPERAADRLRISSLYVDENYRRQGVGRMLVTRASEIAAGQRRRCLTARVRSDNWGAVAFGAEMGMGIVGFDALYRAGEDGIFPLELGKKI